jgi:hypothetical protein
MQFPLRGHADEVRATQKEFSLQTIPVACAALSIAKLGVPATRVGTEQTMTFRSRITMQNAAQEHVRAGAGKVIS